MAYQNKKNFKQNSKILKLKSYAQLNSSTFDDLNNTFFIKDYDNVNPYLNKNSLNRGRLSNKFKQIEDTIALEESLLSDSSLGHHQFEKQRDLKLPKLNKNQSQKDKESRKQKLLRYSEQEINKIFKKEIQNNQQSSDNLSTHKNTVQDTRIDTDDFSLIQNGSSASLLKLSRNSIDFQPLSYLKISKIATNQHLEPLIHKNFIKKPTILPQQNRSEFISLSAPRSMRYPSQSIMEQQTASSSSEDDQYVKDSVPGPGYYSISHHTSFSKPQTKKQFNKKNYAFGSMSSRFTMNKKLEEDQSTQLKLREYEQKQQKRQQRLLSLNKKQKKHVPFNSKVQSQRQNPQNNFAQQMISPVYYNPRYGIEQDLIKKIQKNFKGSFGSEEKRFKTIYRKPYNLGPGSYSIDLKNNQEDNQRMAHYFSSKKARFQ